MSFSSPLLTNLTAKWMREWADDVLHFDGNALGDVPLTPELMEDNHLAHVAATNAKNIGTALSQQWLHEAQMRSMRGEGPDMAAYDFSPEQKATLRYFQALSLRIARSNWSDPKSPGGCQSCQTVCADSSKVLGELYESHASEDEGREIPQEIRASAADEHAASLAYAGALYRAALECDPENYGAARRFVRVHDMLMDAGLDESGAALPEGASAPLDLVYIRAVAAATAADAAQAAARDAVAEFMGGGEGAAQGLGRPNPKFQGHDDKAW